MADQEAFAALTGDRNPMHMDPVAARRTQAGECAVHGMHALLWGLDALGLPLGEAAGLKVEFGRFLRLDAPVTAAVRSATVERVQAELVQDGQRAVAVELALGPRQAVAARAGPAMAAPPAVAADPAFEALEGAAGGLSAPRGAAAAAALFPAAAAALGAETVSSLALMSTLVGMVAPGLNSIFSGFQVAFGETGGEGLGYAVSRVDDRFRLVAVDVTGAGFAGSLRAFARLPPVAAPSLAALEAVVAPDEFAGQRALIVGGSRGLGAVTGKLIAAGGGAVTLTYVQGRAEAEAIAAEIGAERCRILRYDTGEEPRGQLAGVAEPFSHVYYFASGRIFGPATTAVFDAAKFEGFAAVYFTAFERLVGYLLGRWPEAALSVLYPSSVAVEKRPKGITEYAMAKAAGEILCADLMAAHRRLRITAPRLPRIMTDQTATVPPVPAADPVATMLEVLRGSAADASAGPILTRGARPPSSGG